MITVDELYGCHLWVGAIDRDGYGMSGTGRAHRAAYIRAHGAIPAGMVIDHLCRRRSCCNPAHLEAVTQRENLLRRSWGRRSRAKECAEGHDMFLNGLRTPEGGRLCKICHL